MSRSALSLRLDALSAAGLVVEDGSTQSTGGRPAALIRFENRAGTILVADVGVNVSRLAVTDLAANPISTRTLSLPISGASPDAVLAEVSSNFEDMLRRDARGYGPVRGIGIGVPGPVDVRTGELVSPVSMPGWDRYPIRSFFSERFHTEVIVDNDVNLMAWGEYTMHWRSKTADFVAIKIASAGIGCGIVSSGTLHHGVTGAAGAIGHIRISGYDDWVCRCGNTGCLGAVMNGDAIAERLRRRGFEVANGRAVAELASAGTVEAVHEVRSAGRALGEVVAGIISFFNPELIVIGGDIARAHEHLLAGVKEVAYRECTPLGTSRLQILPSRLMEDAGIYGGATMAIDAVLSPSAVNRMLGSQIA
ncbi:MAG TPA: ROK family protein [Acidimicrobiia bacterium]